MAKKWTNISKISVLVTIIVILASTPLGYIPVGFMRATTIQIPVIIGSVLLGPGVGSFLGFVFGLTSFLQNTFNPTLTSFVFTPFYSFSDFNGGFWSLIICFVPRILVGTFSGYIFRLFSRKNINRNISLPIVGFIGSATNTILVMLLIYVFFGESYAAAKNITYDGLIFVIFGIVFTNGILEATISSFLTRFISNPLLNIRSYHS